MLKNLTIPIAILFLFTMPIFCLGATLTPFGAMPDQVLVLYNADWQKDVDGSNPGQDSKEVADYYVRMHTDPVTGKKPHLLGLRCVHGKKHLNDWVIREDSQDNKDGVVFTGKGGKPGQWARDSRHVEIVITPGYDDIAWESVQIWCASDQSSERKRATPIITGAPVAQRRKRVYPSVADGQARCYRFDAHELFAGTVRVELKVRNKDGEIVRDLTLKYYDRDDFKFSVFGEDGIVDEKNFQEDVAIPVKEFLENPVYAPRDGSYLKNHVLYMVVCHGLPFACEGVFGIERGVTSKPRNHGDLGSIEQRLQTLYYGWGTGIVPPVVSFYLSGGPESDRGVKTHRITSALRYPMVGKKWNPYMHPDCYSFLGKKKMPDYHLIQPFPEIRKRQPSYLFAYGVSRIDGQGPKEAKRLIDYSVYASKFLRPEMVSAEAEIPDLPERISRAEKENKWGNEELKALGFRPVSTRNKEGIPFLKRQQDDVAGFTGQGDPVVDAPYPGYYPGAMDRKVFSSNGWNMGRSAPIWQQVDRGVTVSACGGPAYGGGPHITNATFWDNRILMRYLFRGRDLGECFLLSTYYVNWSTSLVGDPLYHPDLSKTVMDNRPPRVASREDIAVALYPTIGDIAGVVSVPVVSTTRAPEVATLRVYYAMDGDPKIQVSSWPIYSTRPRVILRNLKPETTYFFKPELTDPYGNRSNLDDVLGPLTFHTPACDHPVARQQAKRMGNKWGLDFFKMPGIGEQGTLSIEFMAGRNGLIPSIESKQLRLNAKKWSDGKMRLMMKVGGPERFWFIEPVLEKGEKASLVLRWRRFPLTREVLLVAGDGREFTLAADVRTPWEKMVLRQDIEIKEDVGVKVLSAEMMNNAVAASKSACGIIVPPVSRTDWLKSNLK